MGTEIGTSVIDEPLRDKFVFKTEWWEIADGAYCDDKHKFIFLKTIMDFGSRGIIPKGCERKENLKTLEDRIRWSALSMCVNYIKKHDAMAKSGIKGASLRWGKDGTDAVKNRESIMTDRPIADINASISPTANIRCKDIAELKSWFDRFKQNARMIILQGFSGNETDWRDLFEYLDNNAWKIRRGTQYITWGNFEYAVKWAWKGIKDNRAIIASKTTPHRETDGELPGDELRKDDDLHRRMTAKFGAPTSCEQ